MYHATLAYHNTGLSSLCRPMDTLCGGSTKNLFSRVLLRVPCDSRIASHLPLNTTCCKVDITFMWSLNWNIRENAWFTMVVLWKHWDTRRLSQTHRSSHTDVMFLLSLDYTWRLGNDAVQRCALQWVAQEIFEIVPVLKNTADVHFIVLCMCVLIYHLKYRYVANFFLACRTFFIMGSTKVMWGQYTS